jgi:hypothetical protein
MDDLPIPAKMAKVASSPRKHNNIHGWKPSLVSTHGAASQHPATKWFKTTPAAKHDPIISGTITGILTVREPNKIKLLRLLTPSQTFPEKYLGQGSHNLNQTVGIYIKCNDNTKHVISIMAKAMAKAFGFEYLDKDLNMGLHNLADLTATYLTFCKIPDRMQSSNNASTPVRQNRNQGCSSSMPQWGLCVVKLDGPPLHQIQWQVTPHRDSRPNNPVC